MDVTDESPYNNPDAWCDRCADLIEATPVRDDGRIFCGIKCRDEYCAAKLREEVDHP